MEKCANNNIDALSPHALVTCEQSSWACLHIRRRVATLALIWSHVPSPRNSNIYSHSTSILTSANFNLHQCSALPANFCDRGFLVFFNHRKTGAAKCGAGRKKKKRKKVIKAPKLSIVKKGPVSQKLSMKHDSSKAQNCKIVLLKMDK